MDNDNKPEEDPADDTLDEAEEENRITPDDPAVDTDRDNKKRCESQSRQQRYHYKPLVNGRAQGVNALICPSDLKKTGAPRDDGAKVDVYGLPTQNPVTEQTVTGQAGNEVMYEQLHILADKFHGEWSEWNLFTGTLRMNRSGMARCEKKIATQLKAGNWVQYSGELNYGPDAGIPVSITMTAYTKDGQLFNMTILNNNDLSTQCVLVTKEQTWNYIAGDQISFLARSLWVILPGQPRLKVNV